MPRLLARSHARAASIVVVIGVASLGLAGCLDTGFPASPPSAGGSSSGTASAAPSASASPSGSASATPSASPTPTSQPATPISIACQDLIPLQALYDLNPIYALAPAKTADSGTLAAQALVDRGTACDVVRTSSGATAIVTISQPDSAALAADLATAKKSPQTQTSVDASTGATVATLYGTASAWQSFTKAHRYTVEAGSGFDPDDLVAIITIAIQAEG